MEDIKYNADGTAVMSEQTEKMLGEITRQARAATEELVSVSGLRAGDVFVVGCSTSEVTGKLIGHASVPCVAKAVLDGIYPVLREKGIYLAAQCCEHLNRAIIIERDALPFAERVNVVPQPKAGGSLATQAYNKFENISTAFQHYKSLFRRR